MRWPLVFLQHFCIGLVTRMIVQGDWMMVVLVCYLQQLLWWSNVGTRIDLHGSKLAPHLYAGMGASGVALGAMFWSSI